MNTPGDFDEFVRSRGRTLLGFAYVLTGDGQQAEHLVTEVLVRMRGRWDRMTGHDTETSVRAAILHRFLARAGRRPAGKTVVVVPDPPGPGPTHDWVRNRDRLWQRLDRLPSAHRAVLGLRFYADLPDGEIAAQLGDDESAVRARMADALGRLRTPESDDPESLLAATMRDAAARAPSGLALTERVHRASRRQQHRRIAAGATAVVLLAAGIPLVSALAGGSEPTGPAGRPVSPVAGSAGPAAGGPVSMAAGWKPPAFPYRLPDTGGRKAPLATMAGDEMAAFYEATDVERQADLTITVSSTVPVFTTPATEEPVQVRGHAGTLRTVAAQPASQLILFWPESPSRWIRLATDDTYTPEQVITLAESLTEAPVDLLPPFRLDLAPTGLETDAVTASRVAFRPPGTAPGTAGLTTVLRKRRPLTGADRKINGYPAALVHRDDGVSLTLDVTDWEATLEITVAGGLPISDADLLRYAAGIHILDRSDPE